MTNTHVELLPDNNGEYWIPKGYKVKVTADCKDGYTQSNNAIQTVNDTTTINLTSTEAPPSRIDELEEKYNTLQAQITTLSENIIGDTPIPSNLGNTITGSLDTMSYLLNTRMNIGDNNVSLKNYTDIDNAYVTQHDGYAHIYFPSSATGKSGFIRVCEPVGGTDNFVFGTTSGRAYENIFLYIKKGMRLWNDDATHADVSVGFIPLT